MRRCGHVALYMTVIYGDDAIMFEPRLRRAPAGRRWGEVRYFGGCRSVASTFRPSNEPIIAKVGEHMNRALGRIGPIEQVVGKRTMITRRFCTHLRETGGG